ncbi:carboxypeptidase-like regulatory domain-containing protein [Dysgonomonas sp. 520]|uniref:carboxypeptidase-like regulatory domain-containing protein n=1 Tax=Dysgonomonas sp. 520 TaxID=2302931 RepID=UPI0013D2A978|nr:carboxypeptidase-like regulatory domain-containing protein [Dysgonomonas sp. 520]NDW10551.1 hypothetical protein [Dysgonomonas sp. 520]
MRSKIGIIMILACIGSFLLYNYASKSSKMKDELASKPDYLEGFVFDKVTEQPIKDVEIAIKEYNPKVSTDDQGHFYIDAKETDELVFRKSGYAPLMVSAKEIEKVYMFPNE